MKTSSVVFNEYDHSYTLGDNELISVTTLIKKYIQPDLYKGVDKAILNAKAEYGSAVHKHIEMLSSGFPFNDNEKYPEVMAYEKFINDFSWVVEESEYLVSDDEIAAGTIDQVLSSGDNVYTLADIKTTKVLNKEYIKWQLSLYAYMFEKQNEGASVDKLYAIHLVGDECKLVEIERVPMYAIRELIECQRNGLEEFKNPLYASCDDAEGLIKEYRKLMDDYVDLEAAEKPIAKRKKEIESSFKAIAKDREQSQFDTSIAIVKNGAGSVINTFDIELYNKNILSFIKKYAPKEGTKKRDAFLEDLKELPKLSYKVTTREGKVTIKFK